MKRIDYDWSIFYSLMMILQHDLKLYRTDLIAHCV